jgi:hypothetical protein
MILFLYYITLQLSLLYRYNSYTVYFTICCNENDYQYDTKDGDNGAGALITFPQINLMSLEGLFPW